MLYDGNLRPIYVSPFSSPPEALLDGRSTGIFDAISLQTLDERWTIPLPERQCVLSYSVSVSSSSFSPPHPFQPYTQIHWAKMLWMNGFCTRLPPSITGRQPSQCSQSAPATIYRFTISTSSRLQPPSSTPPPLSPFSTIPSSSGACVNGPLFPLCITSGLRMGISPLHSTGTVAVSHGIWLQRWQVICF